jgi:hypothetical protein
MQRVRLETLLGCILRQLKVGYHRGLVARGNLRRIPPVIAMTMRYKHIICLDILWFDSAKRVVPKERINHKAMTVAVDFETGVTVKSDFDHPILSPI